jgi:hypothetical protein
LPASIPAEITNPPRISGLLTARVTQRPTEIVAEGSGSF